MHKLQQDTTMLFAQLMRRVTITTPLDLHSGKMPLVRFFRHPWHVFFKGTVCKCYLLRQEETPGKRIQPIMQFFVLDKSDGYDPSLMEVYPLKLSFIKNGELSGKECVSIQEFEIFPNRETDRLQKYQAEFADEWLKDLMFDGYLK